MKIIKTNLYIEFAELIEVGISSHTIKGGISKALPSWQSIKDPDDKRKLLVRYETLNLGYQTSIEKHYGNPHHYIKEQQAHKLAANRGTAFTYLPDHLTIEVSDTDYFDNIKHITPAKSRQLSRASAWLTLCGNIRGKIDAQKLGFESKAGLLNAVLEHLQNENLEGLKVTNVRVLQRKITSFKKSGPQVLINANYGNIKAQKLGEDQKATLRELYSQHNAFHFTQVAFQFNKMAMIKQWPALSLYSVKTYLSSPAVAAECQRDRYGIKHHMNYHEIAMGRKRPDAPNRLWVMDGSPIELFYREGKNIRKRVYGFLVIDAYSWKIVGYSLGQSETEAIVFTALKNACASTGRLPRQLMFDNSSAIKSNAMMEWYKDITTLATPMRVGNAKAKVIEPLQGHMNTQILKYYDNYAGGNITAKSKEARVNEEWLKNHPECIPNIKGVTEQITAAVEAWNNRTVIEFDATPNELQQIEPDGIELTLDSTISLFWKYVMDRKAVLKNIYYTRNGITFQLNNKKYTYMAYDADGLPDKKFHLEHMDDKFNIKYDPDDLEMIALYQNGKQVYLCQERHEVPMALIEQTKADREHMKGIRKRNVEMLEEIDNKRKDTRQRVEDLELVDAHGYLKAPVPVRNIQKDHLNDAEEIAKGGSKRSIYKVNEGGTID